jgi:glycosyltransferase involved in cell wall biosynthesis
MKPLVTVLIPNYNEIENVKRGVLQDIVSYLNKQSYTSEIIISDDGSTDSSVLLIKEFASTHPQVRIIYNQHAGKPYALRSGIREAKGQYILLTDMDQSTPILELGKLLPWTAKGFDVVIGSRGARRTDSTPFRQLASIIFLVVRRMILLPEIHDTQCGFKLIETKLAGRIFSKMRLFGRVNNAVGWKVTAYDVELLHIAKILGAKIKEVSNLENEDPVLSRRTILSRVHK